jgi:SPP1 gp7 family putative phage head morphogenesis protein|nr:MAG TPA: minor capsid protein [Caudoviricetes sp.]
MKSEEYWNDAALRREIAVQTGTNYTGEEILKLYDEALSDIDTEMQKIKINFQKRFGIDNETAEYFLTQAQQEDNLKTLIKSLEYAPDEQARQDILAYIRRDGLSVRAYAARKERYEAVKAVIYARIKKVAVKEIEKLSERLQAVYKESYYGVIDDAAKQFDVGINFAILNENAINAAVSTKWHGKQFSQRIWDNTDRLATTAQNLVVKSFMSGEAWSKTADKLATTFQVEKYNATRLVHTEASHIHAMADLKAYEDIGAEQYRYLATLDYRTCERCQQWDNMVLPLSEAREGYNYPVLHPLCRCTTTIAVDLKNRRARDPLTGKNDIVDGSVTYQEWYNSLSDEQKTALKLSKRKDSNKTSDKLQHAKYVKVLGTKEVPRSFDKWIDIRYNDSEKYSELKSKYRNAIVSQSRLTNLFSQYNNGQKDLIVFRNIEKELNRSNVGKECIDYLINNPCTVNLYYNIDVRKSLLGEYISGYDEINIYASNTKTVKTTAETIIHEATHRRYNIYGDKHAEAVCIAQEYKHHYNVDKLSFAQKREVIKEVNRNYQSYKWRERHT